MKLDSKLFDAVRIKPRREDKPREDVHMCDWEGCIEPGDYRAPKGNRAEGQYHHFCLEHVRHYNTAFNFFSGMKPEEMEEAIHSGARTDGRASWGLGAKPGNSGPRMPGARPRDPGAKRFADPLNIFARYAWQQRRAPQQPRQKPLLEQDRQALETLGIHGHAASEEIKKAYKSLVKLHHPDANGGNKASEDRLRAIIAAYTHLKLKGFVAR
jgi:DnaJ-domain-containing protein 1